MSQKRISSLWEEHPLLWFLLPFAAGITVVEYGCLPSLPVEMWWGVSAVAFSLMGWSWQQAARKPFFLCALVIGWVALGVGRYISSQPTSKEWAAEKQVWELTIEHLPQPTTKGIRCKARTKEGRKVQLYVAGGKQHEMTVGSRWWVYTQFLPLKKRKNPGAFDEVSYLRRQGIEAVGYASQEMCKNRGEEGGFSPIRLAQNWRSRLSQRYAHSFSGDTLAVIAAMTIGDKQWLHREVRQWFALSGTSHLLALSGLHLGILYSLYQWLLLRHCRTRRGKAIATIVGILLLWGYALLAGLPLSLVRASTMFTLASMANLLRRDVFSLNNLAFAALLLLLFSPTALFDVGFQLSCLSVASILLFVPVFPRFARLHAVRPLQWCYDCVVVSLSAQVGTLPLVAYHFHIIALYGVLANLLLIPLVMVAIFGAVLFFVLPWGQELWVWGIERILGVMLAVLRIITELPGATVQVSPWAVSVVWAYVAVWCLWVAVRKRQKTALLGAVLVGVIIVGGEHYWHRPPAHRLVFYALRQSAAFHYVDRTEQSYCWTTDAASQTYEMRRYLPHCWESENLSSPLILNRQQKNQYVDYRFPLFFTATCRVAVADSTMRYRSTRKPLPVDYLLLVKDFRGGVYKLQQWYAPQWVVLDARLSSAYRQHLTTAAQQLGWKVHDLQEQGALVVDFDAQK